MDKLHEEFLLTLAKNREFCKKEIFKIYQRYYKGEVSSAYLIGDYYKYRALYYSNTDYEHNTRLKRKRQKSLDEVNETNNLIRSFPNAYTILISL